MSRSITLSPAILGASVAVVALAAGGLGFGLAHVGKTMMPASAPASNAGRQPLYWYDPMVPAQHFAKPGKSPYMDMQLVPRYAGGADADQGVQIDPARQQSLGMRLATVARADFAEDFTVAGQLDFNQRDVAIVQARANGFVQKVYARAPDDVVAAGAPIADILVPSWGAAQNEYLAVRQTGDQSLEAAACQRLVLLGMPQSLIDSVAKAGRPTTTVTISTPIGGAIQTLDVRQGMTVTMGQTLAQISGLSSVWLTAAVPETQGAHIKVGQSVTADLTAFPGEPVTGRVSAILPTTQADSRTLSVRVELPNRAGKLRPGMFATVHLDGAASPALSVPTEALIRTGKRTLVMLANGQGRFAPAEVQTGRESGDRSEVLAGLNEGDKVVASGQFLIDSEASLSSVKARPLAAAAETSPAATASALYETRGLIEALKGDSITLSHEPIPAIGWPAMTMTFRLKSVALAKGLETGDRVVFGFNQTPDGPVIEKLQPVGGQ